MVIGFERRPRSTGDGVAMPFTGSHPAAVMPLLRTPLVASALVIGSMAPDAPLFGLSPVSYATTHSARGIVTTDLALGLLLYAIWHVLIVPPALALAPRAVRARVPQPQRRFARTFGTSARWLRLVAVSIAVGATTHVGWDEFTHPDRWGAHHIGVLAESFHGVGGYHWAQYASDVLGAVVILVCLARWWRQAEARSLPGTNAVVSASCGFAVLAVTAGAAAIAATPDLTAAGGVKLHAGAYAAATHGGAAAAVAIILIAFGWHLTGTCRAAASRLSPVAKR